MIYRSLKVIFQPAKKRQAIIAFHAQKELEARTALEALDARKELDARVALDAWKAQEETDNRIKEQFSTVGQLLGRVKWQTPQTTVLTADPASLEYDVSLN
jgi:tripartite-type tricarboxylate transporter receptor subunit TctC